MNQLQQPQQEPPVWAPSLQQQVDPTFVATLEPTVMGNNTAAVLEKAEEEHWYDAVASLLLNITMIGCLLLAYYVKRFRIYYLPESAGALLVGVVVGGIATLSTDRLALWEFSPEVFFFVLLPPIIFEAGYSLNQKDFFDNIGAITLYAMLGTMISTFCVGGLSFYAARAGLIRNIDQENPMEALLFGALISAVDPVATLSIMGNAELNCDPLLYSLVFGESVLNDAVAIALFKVFAKYYKPDGPRWSESEIPAALGSFITISFFSIAVGVGLGLGASYLYKHTQLSDYPKLETSLLLSFCYLCYALAEAVGYSGIMALFFQGMVLSHYNSYNLSTTAHVASEQIFSTMATLAETAVFLYMGMGVFTGRFKNYDFLFSLLAFNFCLLGRFLNIFPLSFLANLCRGRQPNVMGNSSSSSRGSNGNKSARRFRPGNHPADDVMVADDSYTNNRISYPMQIVLWFAGLRGAIAFALAINMPGPNREVYATATLSICIFTTVVCGGLTEGMLTRFDMKVPVYNNDSDDDEDGLQLSRVSYSPHHARQQQQGRRPDSYPMVRRTSQRVYHGTKRIWQQFDTDILQPYFGGPASVHGGGAAIAERGNYELGSLHDEDEDDDDDDHHHHDNRRARSNGGGLSSP